MLNWTHWKHLWSCFHHPFYSNPEGKSSRYLSGKSPSHVFPFIQFKKCPGRDSSRIYIISLFPWSFFIFFLNIFYSPFATSLMDRTRRTKQKRKTKRKERTTKRVQSRRLTNRKKNECKKRKVLGYCLKIYKAES